MTKLQNELIVQQREQTALDNERRHVFNESNNARKNEKTLAGRISQLSENYAVGDQQITMLAKDREVMVKKTHSFVELQDEIDHRFNSLLQELDSVSEEIVRLREFEEEVRIREELEARAELEACTKVSSK